ncbi:MAG: hypothetical protein ABL901_04820 [Hyphomicrobiaceae bacterium]
MTALTPESGSQERSGLRRGVWVTAAALLAGAAYLAVTRADALMLDIARIAGCF